MNIPVAEELVERGDVDMIVMARPLLAEPNLLPWRRLAVWTRRVPALAVMPVAWTPA